LSFNHNLGACCHRIKIPYPLEWSAPTFDGCWFSVLNWGQCLLATQSLTFFD